MEGGVSTDEPSPRREGRRASLLLFFGLGAAALAWFGWRGAPAVIGAVHSIVETRSVQRVESHREIIRDVAVEFGIDPNLIAAIIYVESRGRVDAVSSVGALGLMQLSTAAASDAARKLGLPEPSREELLDDAALNVRLGGNHLAWLLGMAGEESELERVLISYNAGRQKLMRWIRVAGSYADWRQRQIRDGDSQVLAYASNVMSWRERFQQRGVIVSE